MLYGELFVGDIPRNVLRKLINHFRSLGLKLLELHDSPTSLAGGVAIGIFVGFTPLFGLKTLICLGVAYVLRCNPIAAVIAVTLHDVCTPLWPVILEIEYEIGSWILKLLHAAPEVTGAKEFHISDFMKWTTFLGIGLPMLLGSLFLSAPSALISYLVTYPIFKRRAIRRAALLEAESP